MQPAPDKRLQDAQDWAARGPAVRCRARPPQLRQITNITVAMLPDQPLQAVPWQPRGAAACRHGGQAVP